MERLWEKTNWRSIAINYKDSCSLELSSSSGKYNIHFHDWDGGSRVIAKMPLLWGHERSNSWQHNHYIWHGRNATIKWSESSVTCTVVLNLSLNELMCWQKRITRWSKSTVNPEINLTMNGDAVFGWETEMGCLMSESRIFRLTRLVVIMKRDVKMQDQC